MKLCIVWACLAIGSDALRLNTKANTKENELQQEPSPLIRVAFLVRGLFFHEHVLPLSTGSKVLKPYTHSLLRAWPSMEKNIISRMQDCGYSVDTFLATYSNVPITYSAQAKQATKAATMLIYDPNVVQHQFQLATRALQDIVAYSVSNKRQYDLLISTRDDYVYNANFWPVLSARFDHKAINVINNDCANNAWDGFHIFPWSDAPFAIELFNMSTGGRGHSIPQIAKARGRDVVFWLAGMYGQPDRCAPALGEVDRDGQKAYTEHGHCCTHAATDIQKAIEQGGDRQCPLLP